MVLGEQMSISFFGDLSAKNGSVLIRGKQVAEYLGYKINPNKGFSNDACIYVKTLPPRKYPKKTYIDIVDGLILRNWLVEHPDTCAICMSEMASEFLERTIPNKIFAIPQHHCNLNRVRREQREVRVVGYVGNRTQLHYSMSALSKMLSKINLEFRVLTKFSRREDIVSFLREVDINIAFRGNPRPGNKRFLLLKDPLKLSNAGSFGIPSVAFPEPAYKRYFDGCYLEAKNIKDLVYGCYVLKKDPKLYAQYAKLAMDKSEKYHIQNTSKGYRNIELWE
jgi:hypothetical protein